MQIGSLQKEVEVVKEIEAKRGKSVHRGYVRPGE